MKRIVSVYLPHWPIERMRALGLRPGPAPDGAGASGRANRSAPFALVEATQRGVRLSAVDGAAEALGIHAGDALADARAIVPGLAVDQAQPAADRSGLRKLALWLGRYGIARNAYGLMCEAPSGHRIRCYGLWVDIAGVAHLFGGEAALLRDMDLRLGRFKLTARLGLADTFGAAHALAWHGHQAWGHQAWGHQAWGDQAHGNGTNIAAPIAARGASLAAISDLPVSGLRLDRRCVCLLHRLGFKTIGSLAHVPRVALQRRFGGGDDQERVLLRLDQALGVREEPRRPLLEVPALSVRAAFAEPLISADGLKGEVEGLVAALCARLETLQSGARAVRLSFYRCDGSVGAVSVRVARAARLPAHLMTLLGPKLDTLDLGFGADALVLDALRVETLAIEQNALTAGGGDASMASRAQLIDRLANRLGGQNVSTLTLHPSHWPERAAAHLSVLTPPLRGSAVQQRSGHFPAAAMSGRPAVLLPSPEPIAVVALLPEGAPVRFIWRRARHKIVRAQGPERIEPEWWLDIGRAKPAPRRDYYALEDDVGGRFWVFRAGRYPQEDKPPAGADAGQGEPVAPGWYIHGLYC